MFMYMYMCVYIYIYIYTYIHIYAIHVDKTRTCMNTHLIHIIHTHVSSTPA